MKITKKLLNDLSELSDIMNDLSEPYKSSAYNKSVITLKQIYKNDKNYELPTTEKELIKLNGIGKSIAKKIISFNKLGYIPELEKIKKDDMINDILKMTKIYGFGIKGIKKLYNQGYKSHSDLKKGMENGTLKLTNSQKLGIIHHNDLRYKIKRSEINKIEQFLNNFVKQNKKVYGGYILGSYRRGKMETGDVDILLVGDDNKIIQKLLKELSEKFEYIGTLSKGKKKFMGLFRFEKYVRHIDIIYSNKEEYPAKLQYFTGSKDFNIYLRNVAIEKGYKLSDKGLFKNNKQIKLKNEKDIFTILGLEYIEPKNREII